MQNTKTVAYLAALVVTTSLAVSHSSYATQILETLPTETVNRVLPVRPTVKPIAKPTEAFTGKKDNGTEKTRPAAKLPQVNGGSDLFRIESMYVLRLLQKTDSEEARTALGSSVKTSIKAFLDAQQSLRQELEKTLNTDNVMGKSIWNGKVNEIVDTYRNALKPLIAADKGEVFEGYIMTKRTLIQSWYERARLDNTKNQNDSTNMNKDSFTGTKSNTTGVKIELPRKKPTSSKDLIERRGGKTDAGQPIKIKATTQTR